MHLFLHKNLIYRNSGIAIVLIILCYLSFCPPEQKTFSNPGDIKIILFSLISLSFATSFSFLAEKLTVRVGSSELNDLLSDSIGFQKTLEIF